MDSASMSLGRAIWTTDQEMMLITIVQSAMDDSNIDYLKLKPSMWKKVAKDFNESNDTKYTPVQLKSKCMRWKNQWSTWNRIKGQTGVGWDDEKKVLTCGDWDALEKVIPGAKKIVEKGFPYYGILNEMFYRQTATGKYASSQSYMAHFTDDDASEDDDDNEVVVLVDDDESPLTQKSVGKRPLDEGISMFGKGNVTSSKKSKGSKTESEIQSCWNTLMDEKRQARAERKNERNAVTDAYVDMLDTMNLSPEVYTKAVSIAVSNLDSCPLILRLSDEARLNYFRSL